MAQDRLTFDTLAASWLARQCEIVPSVKRGLVVLGVSEDSELTPTACWPEGAEAAAGLLAAAELAVDKSHAVVKVRPNGAKSALEVACPILVDGQLFGVAAIESESTDTQQRAVMQLLQWGVSWLEFIVQREASAVTSRLMTVLELVATVIEQERFHAAAMAAATELARRLSCERVSFGFLAGRHMRVHALSHSVRFSHKTNLLRDIGTAMDEALDQSAIIVFPSASNGQVKITKAHALLARRHSSSAICTVPISEADEIVGAVTFERDTEQEFDPPTVELCEAIVSLLGPILNSKRKQERWFGAKAGHSFNTHVKRLFGPRHPLLKLWTAVIIAVVAVLTFGSGNYRISAPAMIEGAVQRVVVAPADGYIVEANARAGDLVQAGDVLGRLDDKDLSLERVKWTSEREKLIKQSRSALAAHDRTEASILYAKISQADAQIALLDAQLARAQFSAPLDGIIVNGDLSQALGSPVERGQVLFEIAPLDAYRLILNVDEREISNVDVGQRGHLGLSAVPGERIAFMVEKITPVSVAEDGRNHFRVEARLDGEPKLLRPGMQGVGKIEVERRSLFWIWTHKLTSWLRLWIWSWWP